LDNKKIRSNSKKKTKVITYVEKGCNDNGINAMHTYNKYEIVQVKQHNRTSKTAKSATVASSQNRLPTTRAAASLGGWVSLHASARRRVATDAATTRWFPWTTIYSFRAGFHQRPCPLSKPSAARIFAAFRPSIQKYHGQSCDRDMWRTCKNTPCSWADVGSVTTPKG
jgi:hypothetical protein